MDKESPVIATYLQIIFANKLEKVFLNLFTPNNTQAQRWKKSQTVFCKVSRNE